MSPDSRGLRAAWRDDDRGAVTTQLVLVVPVLMLMVLLIVQFAVAWHAQHIAQSAAARALAAARVEKGGAGAGQERARQTIAALGGRILLSPQVQVRRTATEASVRVEGRVMAVVPGLNLRVSGTAHGPVERFVLPGQAR
ncbi:TadE/TadG family type IV pilus assembly protein [Streptomyces sp. N35]|uniref:TadE/TadG family type IV pilus assembly protein n=1 Tax=Streptomyces sp. N35 TaxID=2795730 RepID=UPI0027DD1DBB|nr:TadE/TadG family type IV pilus assembly protein [Streptomyces sp. N35]